MIFGITAAIVSLMLTSGSSHDRALTTPRASQNPPVVGTVRTFEVPGGLTDVGYGYGSLWAPGFGVLHRLDPRTGKSVADIPVPGASDYRHVAFAAGSVWVTDSGTEQLTRIDPVSNHILATISLGASPTAITVVGHTLWLTYTGATSNGLVPVDPNTNRAGARIQLERGDYLVTAAAHSDNTFWTISTTKSSSTNLSQQLVRIDATTHRRVTRRPLPDSLRLFGILSAQPRTLWFAGPNDLVRVDPTTLKALGPRVPIAKAQQVVVTPKAVWILTNLNSTQGGRPGQIWELNAHDLTTVGSPHQVGETPVRLLVTNDNIWVANYTDATITAITLR